MWAITRHGHFISCMNPPMRCGSTASWVVSKGLVRIAALAIVAALPASTHALWGPARLPRTDIVRLAPPDQSWLQDVPEKPGAHSKGKVAVFPIAGDDVYEIGRAHV